MMKKVLLTVFCASPIVSGVLPILVEAAPSHMSHPAPKPIAIQAPYEVEIGEAFTLKITNEADKSPIEGGEIFLLKRHRDFFFRHEENHSVEATALKSLGKTNANGEVEVILTNPGQYFLVADKAGFSQAFKAITVAEAAQSITFAAEKTVFNRKENIRFTLKNSSKNTVTLSCGAPWQILDTKDSFILSPDSIMVIIDVNPGEEKTWSWDRKNDHGEEVPPGEYTVVIRTSEGSFKTRFFITGLKPDKQIQNPEPKMPDHSPFRDVTGKHGWGDPHILRLHQRNIIRGKSADFFDPDGSLSRAEFVSMLLRACGLEPAAGNKNDSSDKGCLFEDVHASHWAYLNICIAQEMGLIKPDEYPTRFEPDLPITRMEICVMAVRAMGLEDEASKNAGKMLPFDDRDSISASYSGYVSSAVNRGVVKGYPDYTFRPQNSSTRREAAVIIYRLIQEANAD